MQSPPVRLPLPPGTTAHQLMAQGMPESSAYHALKRGWYCPGYNPRDYPQHDGAGGFAILETPERFVRAYVLRTLAQWEFAPSPDLVEGLPGHVRSVRACASRRGPRRRARTPAAATGLARGGRPGEAIGMSFASGSSPHLLQASHDRERPFFIDCDT